MSNVIDFADKPVRLAEQIGAQIAQARAQQPLVLPSADAPIVELYVQQIEGTYDTARSRTDTDHAIELLYIAYNATPQAQGSIRNAISSVMGKLIDAQQNSQRSISEAADVATMIGKKLHSTLQDWLDVKDSEDPQETRQFIADDLLAIARLIEQQASSVKDKLLAVAKDYDLIITDTEKVTQNSELALSEVFAANEKLRGEMLEAKARSEALEELVRGMREQVARFMDQARDFQAQAESAERKAEAATFLQGLLQVINVVLPIVALVSGAGAPAMAAGAMISTVGTQVAAQRSAGDAIKLREDQSRMESESKALHSSIDDHDKQVQELRAELQKEGNEEGSEASAGLNERIAKKQQELDEAVKKKADLDAAIVEAQSALAQLEGSVSTIGKQQDDKAAGLRELQLEMVSKAEDYENKRAEHESELIKVKVLLAGQRDEQETNELAIRSLNLSMSALKRTKEIVEEIAHFFMSFSAFVQSVADSTIIQAQLYEEVGSKDTLRRHKKEMVLVSTDEFFITQAAQWLAVMKVCEIFAKAFEDGWTKLNALNGTYITGDELDAYLQTAAVKLGEIAQQRGAMKVQRLSNLKAHRKQIQAKA